MNVAGAQEPRVLHTVPGRIRVHLPAWSGQGQRQLEAMLGQLQGVRSVQASTLTGNVLIHFDPQMTTEPSILQAVHQLDLPTGDLAEQEPARPPALRTQRGKTVRARIAVRGMDRDPRVAKRVVAHLNRRPGVHARAITLTGHVLVEFAEHEVDLDDLICDVADIELPDVPGEDRPTHPLDPGPLIQGTSRVIGAALGIGLLATRFLVGTQTPLPAAAVAGQTATMVNIVEGIPPVRFGLRKLVGRTVADLLLNVPAIVTLTLSENLLGLAVTGTESLRLATEVQARRRAWLRHEARIASAPSAQADAVIRLEAGERPPLPAKVLAGAGTALGRDGWPLPAVPGRTVPAGARLSGGPFVLQLESEAAFQPFTPQPRPVDVAPSRVERYAKAMGPVTLAYAVATAILTRSFSRTLVALLLVGPRPAVIGLDSADLGASARVLRAGVTIVGTRPQRVIRLPDYVFLDGARLLTDRLELLSALPLYETCESAELLARAAGIAAAAGSPWGGIFRVAQAVPATQGSFDGTTASAYAEGVQYTLGPVADWSELPDAARFRQHGNYVLVLRSQQDQRPLGLVALRPLLAAGMAELVQVCQRYGIGLGVLSGGDQIAVQALARRAQVTLLDADDAVGAIRAKQAEGAYVAFVSDNAGAAAAFAACDLAIGLSDDRARLPARADLLAPDLVAVAAILDAGTRSQAIVRDAIGVSVVSSVVAGVLGLLGLTGMTWALRTIYLAALVVLADGWLRWRG